ncbi:hypothetical protein [Brenneria tiliae]|uniref:hypothetical protein n=1 Tax=Brenneria tiliae TaxID=2914984 RepID=UPI002014DEA8|nr:hypothetical protein [Brenneria tiliae]MCL2895919.1 hypothetical protein [Brenneria tiliae]MCL2902760.1 hypothetical protein [Brenneria tiliae]
MKYEEALIHPATDPAVLKGGIAGKRRPSRYIRRFFQVMKHFVPGGYYCAAKDADKRKLFFPFKGLLVDFWQSDKQETAQNPYRICAGERQW